MTQPNKSLIFPCLGMCIILISLVVLSPIINTASAAERRLDPKEADSLAALTDDFLKKADYYSDAWMYKKVLEVLRAPGKDDAEVLWRMARAHIDMGEALDKDESVELYEQAMEEAQAAVDLDPKNALAQQTLSIACGRVALFKGVFKSLGLVKRVHAAGLQSVAVGDSVPIAWYVLGRTHKKLIEKPGFLRGILGIGWANEDSVAYYFDNALKVSGGNMIQCRVEYGDFLINTKEDKDAAKKMLDEALKLNIRDENDSKAIIRAKKMLEEMK